MFSNSTRLFTVFFLIALIIFLIITLLPQYENKRNVKIYTTIPPVQSLLMMITEGITDSDCIIKNQNPHTYYPTANDLINLENSNLIFYIDDNFEHFISKAKIGAKKVKLLDKVNVLKARHTPKVDKHIWLSTKNAKIILDTIYQELIYYDPKNKEKYHKNLLKSQQEISELETKIQDIIPKNQKEYLVSHDAYRYFENDFNIREPKLILYDNHQENSNINIEKILELQNIDKKNPICLIAEIGDKHKFEDQKNSNIKTIEIDAEGLTIQNISAKSYINMMLNIARNIQDCVG